MSFVLAFVIGGALCLVFQVVLMCSRIEVPNLLIAAFAVGAVLSVVGACDVLGEVGGGGFMITLIGAAQAIYEAAIALFGGEWAPLCIVTSIFAALTVLGIVAGMMRVPLEKDGD